MDSLEIRIVEGGSELDVVGSLMLQLRSGYDLESMVSQIEAQQERGYTVACAEEGGRAIDSELRSSGLGRAMMDWLKGHAREHGCEQIHLDSGVQRFPAHRFYLREGFNIASHHFSIVDLK